MNLSYTFSALFSMVLVAFIGILSLRTGQKPKDRLFRRFILVIMVFCLVDAMWGAFYSGVFRSTGIFTLVAYLAYFMSGVVTLIWFDFMVEYSSPRVSVSYILRTVASVLLIIQVLILISNYFTHELFFINSDGAYFTYGGRTQLQFLQCLTYISFFLYGIVRLFFGKTKDKKSFGKQVFYSLIPGLFVAGQTAMIDVPMYSYGFSLTIVVMMSFDRLPKLMERKDKEYKKERNESLSIINGLAGDFSTIYSVNIETGGFVVYNRTDDEQLLQKIDNSKLDYFRICVEKGRKMVHEDDLESFLLTMDKDVIKRKLDSSRSFELTLRIRFGDSYKYMEYRFTGDSIKESHVIIGVYDVDKSYRKKLRDAAILKTATERQMALEEEAALLDRAAHRDIMTGLYNRRAYEDYLEECKGMPVGEDFVYASIDLNGLKAINDDLGHEAGDELIKAAAFCMKKALGEYGYIYRHGGDEFSAILHVDSDKITGVFRNFDKEMTEYRGKYVNSVSASYGFVGLWETGVVPILEMAKAADKRMYEAKSNYYAKNGIDRRGQQEAYDVIRKSYIKILKVDLLTDSFSTIYMGDSEADSDKGYDDKISKWIHDFASTGNVHPEDARIFMKTLDINSVREHFCKGRENIAVHYRRKADDGYNNALLEIVPARNYSPKSQIVFLYVKNIY